MSGFHYMNKDMYRSKCPSPFFLTSRTHMQSYTHLYSPFVVSDNACGFMTWLYLTQGHSFCSTHKPPACFTKEVASSVVLSRFLHATTIWERQTMLKETHPRPLNPTYMFAQSKPCES